MKALVTVNRDLYQLIADSSQNEFFWVDVMARVQTSVFQTIFSVLIFKVRYIPG